MIVPDVIFRLDEFIFVWDADKARINLHKHGITFETAAHIFLDDLRLEELDRKHSTAQESRYITIGLVEHVLTVVYCERQNGEILRIISARPATALETDLYNDTAYGRF